MQSPSMETINTAASAAAALPDDLLAGIFGLLPARSVAASRGVCKAWRDIIDERQVLLRLRSLLPHSLRGLFFTYEDYARPHFFSRPTLSSSGGPWSPWIHGKFDFVDEAYHDSRHQVVDHCNGLVLYLQVYGSVLHVCNPAMQWSARLPGWPGAGIIGYCNMILGRRAFLVFDPFVSPEHKVLLSPDPNETRMERVRKDDACYMMEWPPSPWESWCEFSSSTGRWEEKAFVREGEAAGTAGDLLQKDDIGWGCPDPEPHWHYGAYWQGALYVHCRGEYISRFSLLDDKYRVIKMPIQLADKANGVRTFLGKSEKGVYIAAIDTFGSDIIRVWTLNESDDLMEWVPKDQSNLEIKTHSWWLLENKELDKMKHWILDLDNNGIKNPEVSLEQNICWISDDDNIDNIMPEDEEDCLENIKFLGFHPYKEVIFLSDDCYAVALHLNSAKLQYLGLVNLPDDESGIRESFVYTPCFI